MKQVNQLNTEKHSRHPEASREVHSQLVTAAVLLPTLFPSFIPYFNHKEALASAPWKNCNPEANQGFFPQFTPCHGSRTAHVAGRGVGKRDVTFSKSPDTSKKTDQKQPN